MSNKPKISIIVPIYKIKESYSDTDSKLKEYDSLKEIEASYNKLISSKRDDLIHKICGKDKKKAEKLSDWSIDQLETHLELIDTKKGGKGITPQNNHVDDGNDPDNDDGGNDEENYSDEQFEEDFKNSGL